MLEITPPKIPPSHPGVRRNVATPNPKAHPHLDAQDLICFVSQADKNPARASATRRARRHQVPLIYLEGINIVRDRSWFRADENGDLIEIDAGNHTISLLIPTPPPPPAWPLTSPALRKKPAVVLAPNAKRVNTASPGAVTDKIL